LPIETQVKKPTHARMHANTHTHTHTRIHRETRRNTRAHARAREYRCTAGTNYTPNGRRVPAVTHKTNGADVRLKAERTAPRRRVGVPVVRLEYP
jgi:hypothetical protein